MERPFAWKKYQKAEIEAVMAFAAEYRDFLSRCKTERECVSFFKSQAIKAGYRDLRDVIAQGIALHPGDRVFADNRAAQEFFLAPWRNKGHARTAEAEKIFGGERRGGRKNHQP